jgi:hypothetical protein
MALDLHMQDRKRAAKYKVDCDSALPGALMMDRKELYQERQWELYRRKVAEGMADSDYRTAVLAGIEHELMKLDSLETGFSSLTTEDAHMNTRGQSGWRGPLQVYS